MKKLFVTLFALSAVAFTSCDNENSVNPQPLGTAKISGTVFADFDYTNNVDGKTWDKVANKKVIVALYDEYTETVRFVETTTDANGNYTLDVEIGNRGLEAEFQLVDFKQTVKHEGESQEETFYGDNFTFENGWDPEVWAVKGGEYIRDIYYND
jgi:hypothetical protein